MLEKRRRMGQLSLFYFAKYIIGFKDMEVQPHWELCRFLEVNDGEDLLILLPRGTFKSSVISVAFPLWKLIGNKNLRFLLSGGELDHTKNFLSLISDIILRSPDFRMLYGDLSGGKTDTWTKTAVSVEGRTRFRAEESITASSYKVSKVSQHYDYAILDDLHNEKNHKSKELVDQVWNYLELIQPILDPVEIPSSTEEIRETKPSPRIVVGTRWHDFDCYGRILTEEKIRRKKGQERQWKVLIREDRYKSGKLYFPTRLTEAFLKRMQESMSRYNYSCQYRNNPLPDEERKFRLVDFGWFWFNEATGVGKKSLRGRVTDMSPHLDGYLVVDPSIGETNESDYTAIVTNKIDPQSNFFCWEVVRERLVGNAAIIQESVAAYRRNNCVRMAVETYAFQKSLYLGMQAYFSQIGFWIPVQCLDRDNERSKGMRIEGFQPFVVGGRFYLRVKEETDLTADPDELYYSLLDGQGELLDEFIRYPVSSTDDCMDAQSYIPQVAVSAVVPPPPPPDPMCFAEIRRRALGLTKSRLSLT